MGRDTNMAKIITKAQARELMPVPPIVPEAFITRMNIHIKETAKAGADYAEINVSKLTVTQQCQLQVDLIAAGWSPEQVSAEGMFQLKYLILRFKI